MPLQLAKTRQLVYPGNYEPVSKDEWKDAVALAEAVVSWAMKIIDAGP